jgi:hypothetical protein
LVPRFVSLVYIRGAARAWQLSLTKSSPSSQRRGHRRNQPARLPAQDYASRLPCGALKGEFHEPFDEVFRYHHVVVSAKLVLELAEPAKMVLADPAVAQRREEKIRCIAQLLDCQAQLMAGLGREVPEVPAAF